MVAATTRIRKGTKMRIGSAQAQRDAGARGAGQRAQDLRRLAGRLAGACALDGEDVLEIGDQVVGRHVAPGEVLGRHAIEDRGQRGGDLGPAVLQVGQLLADVLHRHRDLVLAVEGHVAGEHLVEDDAERVEVGLAGDRVAERLLG